MTPDGKTFDPETVTDKQLVQYEQAIDRGLTEADAMRLTEHEYNGFQANAIIAAALNPAVGEDVLDALATPKYTAAQMTAIAKIAIRGGDFARFLDPQMDARRMEAAYLVVAHGGSDLPVERLSRSQLLTINNILLQGLLPYETVRAIAKPAFTPESMEVIAAAMENARHDPYTGEHSLTEAQVARIMNPEYRPEQQIALLTAMRGQTPVLPACKRAFHRHQHLVFPCILGIHLPNSFLFLRKTGARCLRPCSGTAPCRNLTILRALWHNLFRDAVK